MSQKNVYSYLLTARYITFQKFWKNLLPIQIFHRPEANKPGVKTLFVPRIGNIMGLVFGLRGVLIYTKTYLMSDYKDDWLFEAIEQIQVRLNSNQ